MVRPLCNPPYWTAALGALVTVDERLMYRYPLLHKPFQQVWAEQPPPLMPQVLWFLDDRHRRACEVIHAASSKLPQIAEDPGVSGPEAFTGLDPLSRSQDGCFTECA